MSTSKRCELFIVSASVVALIKVATSKEGVAAKQHLLGEGVARWMGRGSAERGVAF